MKWISILTLLMFGLLGCANKLHPKVNQPLLGFKEIHWGDTKTKAKKTFLANEGIKYESIDKEGNTLFFEGDTYCGEPMPTYSLGFVDDKFYSAFISVIGGKHTYNKIVGLVLEKYGKPTSVYDDNLMTSTTWVFTDSSSIYCSYDRGQVHVMYYNQPLRRIVDQREKQKEDIERKKTLKSL